ncbi:MAG: RHS repeat-associated core domain-containing protein [Polyangiaceae bacterium]|nr:RHS repeat-associated core domain-containing protein [Polyangiaceae bacterium]
MQDLNYTFDPVGNIVEINDLAQQGVFFADAYVAPANQYLYDALYRLIEASGREHRSVGDVMVDNNDQPLRNLPHPNDPNAMRNYVETYDLDKIGNILELFHDAGSAATWTRPYVYVSQTNRLATTGPTGSTVSYTHDVHGNMIAMPHLSAITWTPFDQMQSADKGGGGIVYFTYGADGQRVRKVWEQTATSIRERIYLGGYELYREREVSGLVLERQTLHVMDGVRRIAMVETKTVDNSVPPFTPTPRLRYQLGNHLGSALLEVDETGLVISYEEYHPYGTSAYRSARASVDVSARRYRYTGKERDEETGLYYHGARYYASWLARWTSADPMGLDAEGPCLYRYCGAAPTMYVDPSGYNPVVDVNPGTSTITYSLNVHLYAPTDKRAEVAKAAAMAQDFFQNPHVKGTITDTAEGRSADSRAMTYVDEAGKAWTVKFDVRFEVHAEPSPVSQIAAPPKTQGTEVWAFLSSLFLANYEMTEAGFGAGDAVLTYYDYEDWAGSAASHGRTFNLDYGVTAGEMRLSPYSNKQGQYALELIHEVGHLLGFEDRYFVDDTSAHPGFDDDMMASGGLFGDRVIHPIHVEDAAKFALRFAGEARVVEGALLRAAQLDYTSREPSDFQMGEEGYFETQEWNRARMVKELRARYEPTGI